MSARSAVVAAVLWAAVSGLGSGPVAAQAPTRPARITFVSGETELTVRPVLDALRAGLLELGQAEGRGYEIEVRYARGQTDRYPALVAESIERGADLIITTTYPAALAAKQATRSVPIVGFSCGLEALVDSLARPGGNLTGVTCQSAELVGKQLELLWEILPALKRVVVLANPASTYAQPGVQQLREAARARGMRVTEIAVRTPADFEGLAAQIRQAGAEAVVLAPDSVLMGNRVALLGQLQPLRLPVMGFFREFVDAGALIAYSANRPERFRRMAWYVDRILKGAKPADLPVEQPTRFELVINLKTAKALGITIPQLLLLRADEVIE